MNHDDLRHPRFELAIDPCSPIGKLDGRANADRKCNPLVARVIVKLRIEIGGHLGIPTRLIAIFCNTAPTEAEKTEIVKVR